MRKTKEEIEIEFAKAYSNAQELEDVAVALTGIASSIISKEIGSLEKGWKGNNATLLSIKSKTLSNDLFDTAQNLLMISKSIRSTADIVYKAEKAAVMMAMR